MKSLIASTPVTILAGFLGSGKSTLLNALLKSGKLPPTAIIVNEFGDTAIDNDLIEGVAEGVSLLGSGCVCCVVRSDLEATMRDLVLKRTRGVIPQFEAVIVEMSGLAEPGAVLQTVASQPMRQLGYKLGPVVSTFDAVHGLDSLQRFHEARHQIAVADRIVVTKSDLVDDLGSVRQALADLNPQAETAIAVSGDISPDWILGTSRHAAGPVGEAAQAHDHHDHAIGVNSTTLWFDRPLDWDSFERRVRQMLRKEGPNILRLKGLINLVGLDHPVAIHAVHHNLYPLEQLPAWPGEDRRSRIVIIAEGAGAEQIGQALAAGQAPAGGTFKQPKTLCPAGHSEGKN